MGYIFMATGLIALLMVLMGISEDLRQERCENLVAIVSPNSMAMIDGPICYWQDDNDNGTYHYVNVGG